MNAFRRLTSRGPMLLGCLCLAGCAAAAALGPLGPIAMNMGRNILSAAVGNYGSGYSSVVEDFFSVLQKTAPGAQMESTPVLVAMSTENAEPGTPPPAPDTPPGSPGTRGADAPLEVEFELVREVVVDGRAVLARIGDGDTLRDGRGDPEGGDNFKILVRPRQECWVYLVSVDATGWIQPLYPIGFVEGTSPMPVGKEVQVPPREWFFLDQIRGVETIYLLAARERCEDFEKVLHDLANRERPESGDVRVEEPDVIGRGIAGVRPGRKTMVTSMRSGEELEIQPSSFFAKAGEGQLLLTRWFRHE